MRSRIATAKSKNCSSRYRSDRRCSEMYFAASGSSRDEPDGGRFRSALADAAKKRDKATIRALLEQHVDVNTPQDDGTTALHWAAERDDLETAAMLVRAGANVKAANRYGVTPLSLACTNGNAADDRVAAEGRGRPEWRASGRGDRLMTASRTGKLRQ